MDSTVQRNVPCLCVPSVNRVVHDLRWSFTIYGFQVVHDLRSLWCAYQPRGFVVVEFLPCGLSGAGLPVQGAERLSTLRAAGLCQGSRDPSDVSGGTPVVFSPSESVRF